MFEKPDLEDSEIKNLDQIKLKLLSTFKRLILSLEKINSFVDSLSRAEEDFPNFKNDIERLDEATQRYNQLIQEENLKFEQLLQGNLLTEDDTKNVRHDLRSQIGAILGYCELLQEELLNSKDDLALRYCQILSMTIAQVKSSIPIIDSIRIENIDDFESYSFPDNQNTTLHEENDEYNSSCGEYDNAKVLIIDDSFYNREILSRRLSKYGVQVITAENGAIGLEKIKRQPVDLILLDIIMPVMDGYETLFHLKSDEKTKSIPVLMISALSEVESIVHCIKAGAVDYLPTPFNPVILNARIKSCLDKKLLHDREQEHFKQLEQTRQRLATSIESIEDGFAVYDSQDRLVMSNKKFQEMYPGVQSLGYTGFTHKELLRENYKLGVYFKEKHPHKHENENSEHNEDWVALFGSRHKSATPYLVRLKDGRWIEITNSVSPDGGLVSLHNDVTARKEDEERLAYLALHDPLTGLVNRSAFEAHLDQEAFQRSNNLKGSGSMMFLDLDGLKTVNDKLGHEAGDELLIKVATAIKNAVRNTDVVARLGGDEFAILLFGEKDKEKLAEIAARIIQNVGNLFEYDGQKISYGISVGISIYPDDATKSEDFIKYSDMAMYAAKNSNKGNYYFYSEIK